MKKVLENQVFEVFFKEVRESAQKLIKDYLIVAPKRSINSVQTGVGVLPVAWVGSKPYIGMIKIHRQAVEQSLWEIPKGFLEDSEEIRVSAVRELHEEIGIALAPDQFSALGSIMPEASLLRAEVMLFWADLGPRTVDALQGFSDFSSTELGHEEIRFFEIGDAIKLALTSITDPCTVAALFRFAHHHYRWGDRT